jgi:hypothetical protein
LVPQLFAGDKFKSLKNNHKNNALNLGGIDDAINRSSGFSNWSNWGDWC